MPMPTLWTLYGVLLLFLRFTFVFSAPGSCGVLSPDQLQSVPGWAFLQKAVESNYGTEPYKIVTNDSQFPEKPASMCSGIAKGWVWFEYHARTKGHYKWSFKIEGILPQVDDRRIPDVLRVSYPAKLRREADFSDL
ncbi:hypothetical protein FB45DRAFT_907108 [Roridomyces roridus]|uniref:Uncharacterized protein n=1 Tax=Roridomyces roridus TaxID=1738132 RepID=A0AAD7C247_9AGAR|nr:hypothetical protein FB45DRAFT_907108 [Roridomyces roridus]